jgi:hypothetical protein
LVFEPDDLPSNHDFIPSSTNSLVLSVACLATRNWLRDLVWKLANRIRHWYAIVYRVALLQS